MTKYGKGFGGDGYNLLTHISHGGRAKSMSAGVVNVPVVRASTVLFESLDDLERGYNQYDMRYGRYGTQSVLALRDWVADFEGADDVWFCGCGMEAILFVLQGLAENNDTVLVSDNVYLPTKNICEKILKTRGVKVEYYDPNDVTSLLSRMGQGVKLVFMESPGSSTFELIDSTRVAEKARQLGVITVLDHTWSAGYFYRPLLEGIDVAIQSGSKYLGGHADIMMGVISVKKGEVRDRLKYISDVSALSISPDNAWLALRGARTLSVRLDRHQTVAMEMANWLEREDSVAKVLYPGLPSFQGHDIWTKRYSGASGLMGILLKGSSRAGLAALVDNMELFGMGYSWGSFESLILPQLNVRDFRTVMDYPDDNGGDTTLVRLHIGLEDVDDLKRDLSEGFSRRNKAMNG